MEGREVQGSFWRSVPTEGEVKSDRGTESEMVDNRAEHNWLLNTLFVLEGWRTIKTNRCELLEFNLPGFLLKNNNKKTGVLLKKKKKDLDKPKKRWIF